VASPGQPSMTNKRERTAVTACFEGAPVPRKKPIRQERQWNRIAWWDEGDDDETVLLGDQ